jgi:hypothetical protein
MKSPHPVAGATPLSQIGRGAGGEGLFSGESDSLCETTTGMKIGNTENTEKAQRYTKFIYFSLCPSVMTLGNSV